MRTSKIGCNLNDNSINHKGADHVDTSSNKLKVSSDISNAGGL